jgi:hypothetical protein
MINSPLIIIIKNIIGNKVDDFHRFIFKHKIILYINMRMIIVTGWVNVVKKILIINKSMSHIKYEIHIVFVILIYKLKKKIVISCRISILEIEGIMYVIFLN